jgi:hypothetical protein
MLSVRESPLLATFLGMHFVSLRECNDGDFAFAYSAALPTNVQFQFILIAKSLFGTNKPVKGC